ncbi:hypothetical protein Droror1_Dr00006481 [Drosera rotundifolia]
MAEEPPPTEDYTVNTVEACVLAEPSGFSSDQGYIDEKRHPRSKMERWADEDSDEGQPRAIQFGTMPPGLATGSLLMTIAVCVRFTTGFGVVGGCLCSFLGGRDCVKSSGRNSSWSRVFG